MRYQSKPFPILAGFVAPLVSVMVAHASIPADTLKSVKIETVADGLKKAEPEALPAPAIGWLKWATFEKLYVGKLKDPKTTDEQRLAIIKVASTALDRHLTALTPDQLHRVISTMETESARLDALSALVASTRYNNDDISKITASFSAMKDDARALCFAIGGHGGY